MSWSERARKTIAEVHATLPDGISFKDRKAAIKAAYPFGERSYWPYKMWCKAQREYLRKYDPKTPAPLFEPSAQAQKLRAAVAAGDIVFPFAERSE